MRIFIAFLAVYFLLLFPLRLDDVVVRNPNVQTTVYIIPQDEMSKVETIKI